MLMPIILISRMAAIMTAMTHSTAEPMIMISITIRMASIRASQRDAEIPRKIRRPSATLQ